MTFWTMRLFAPGAIWNPWMIARLRQTPPPLSDLAKPAESFPELYQDWGDSEAYSLKLGRGECAS